MRLCGGRAGFCVRSVRMCVYKCVFQRGGWGTYVRAYTTYAHVSMTELFEYSEEHCIHEEGRERDLSFRECPRRVMLMQERHNIFTRTYAM